MPELIEVEGYRNVAEAARGALVGRVHAPDAWYLKGGTTAEGLRGAVEGARVLGARRHGKLLVIGFDRPVSLGLRFGMTGRLLLWDPGRQEPVDAVGALLYAPAEVREEHIRFRLELDDGRSVALVDPRRLGGVELDPPEAGLGVDAARMSAADLRRVLADTRAGAKAVLMDQHRVAGLGNLLVDEILWRARISPRAPAAGLTPGEVTRLARAVGDTLGELSGRGGSHTGDLQPARQPGARCPRCGAEVRRGTVAGRTTYWCAAEQPDPGPG